MFCVQLAPPFISSSVQYGRLYNLSRAWRGVRCITGNGSITPEMVYKEKFTIRSSQIGPNKTATIEAIASLLQDTSCNLAQTLGWSTDGFPTPQIMREKGFTWVIRRAHIEIYKYPVLGDKVEIEHWSERDMKSKIAAGRLDFIIRKLSTGEQIGRSTRLAFPEKNNLSLRKIPQLDDPADYCQLGLKPRRSDLDMNKHVNNVTYYSWLLEGIPEDIAKSHELEAITIEYQRECQYSDSIDSFVGSESGSKSINESHDESTLSSNSDGRRQFLHLLEFSGSSELITKGRTLWRKMNK